MDIDDASCQAWLDATTDAIAIHRRNQLVYANRAALEMFGFASLDQVIGRSPFEFVGAGFRALVADRIFRGYSQHEQAPPIEERLVVASGREIPVQVFAMPVTYQGEASTLVQIRDLTERKALEARFRASSRLASLGLVTAGIAHEINTPLTYALCNLDLLAQRLGEAALTDEVGVLLGSVRDGLEDAARVARQVKMLSQGEPWQRAPLDLHAVLDRCAKLVEVQMAGRGRIVKRYGTVPMVFGNEGRLVQVFLNLLLSAAEGMPEGATDYTVTIRTLLSEGSPVVEIRDTGPGLPPEVVEHVFEPLFTTERHGTGVGMATARSLVEEEGGTLALESQVGRGSVFRVTLHRATAEYVGGARPTVAAHARGKRILIVEDERQLASTLQVVLDTHDTAVAASGREALERLGKGERYDLLLCDVAMPDVDGIDLYRRIREEYPGLEKHILFISGGLFSVRATEFFSSVDNRCLEKPFETSELIAMVDETLESLQPAATGHRQMAAPPAGAP